MDTRTSVIEKRLENVKRIISVASGKGGVGKSLVASALAISLTKKGYNVGLFDLDLYGPSSHIILGVKDEFPKEEKGIIPPKINGINFMSIVYFTQDKPAPFRGVDLTNIIIELLAITQWGSLDYLIVDMPPGLGNETLDVIKYMKKSEFLVVTTPSKVAFGAVSKLILLLKELKIPIIGVFENMKVNKSNLIKESILKMKVDYIGSISFDYNLESSIGNVEKLKNTDFMKQLNKIISNNRF